MGLHSPFWGSPSSKANFCEEDYLVTKYIAEFVNTLTNLAYVLYAIYGLRQLRRKSNVDFFRALPYWGLMAVGICSGIFHTSLHYHTQMMDDLSMLFTTTPVLHRVLTVNSDRRNSSLTAIILASALAIVVAYHMATDELLLHSVTFVASIFIIGVRTIQLINTRVPGNSVTRTQIWGMVRFGAVIFHLGYAVWILDGWVCGFLRSSRRAIGLPWAFLLELHGWWHIFTGIGAYIFIAVIDYLVSDDEHLDVEGSFAWPAAWASQSIFAGMGSSSRGEAAKKQE
ncbi:alkaline ceramidase family protein [Penicillium subrubescens]|uniref:alkaline ceramidase family protein n=1 Tax=Penicillium subrubescens TaxID=1316194 RepID=UPI002544EF08|nr:alkaline ceramidase family protein [Penicillium subrubescens]KAJ5883004.1 alkaline ceramidase family protein [Penicillium subrubescens]